MEIKKILSSTDHTLLSPTATWEEIRKILDDGIEYEVASACIPPCFVKRAKEYVGERLAICTVIGFPLGYGCAKAEEARLAIADGAEEIDTVINLCDLKCGRYEEILSELRELRRVTEGKILKVIIETCLLTEAEKIEMCRIVTESGADYIKTSTGFSTGGATPEDISLFSAHVGEGVKIKAAGGISTLEDAENFLALGADRLGSSRIIKLVKSLGRN